VAVVVVVVVVTVAEAVMLTAPEIRQNNKFSKKCGNYKTF
jgi:hypothetical protein